MHALTQHFFYFESSFQVRRHGIILLTQLVMEDYVKLRGPLFYRLVCALADVDNEVRLCAEQAMVAALGQRSRGLLHAKFTEVVLVTTGCASQPAFAHLLDSGSLGSKGGVVSTAAEVSSTDLDSASALSLQVGGSVQPKHHLSMKTLNSFNISFEQVRSPALRRVIYGTLLNAMSEEHRLTVYAKLSTDILGAVAEGTLSLTTLGATGDANLQQIGTTELLLTEVLLMLSTSPLRMASKRSANSAVAAEDDDEGGAEGVGGAAENVVHASVAAAKSRLIARLLKRQIAESVLPVVLGLRQVLQAHQSPVMGPLIGYIKTLLGDFGDEIKGGSHKFNGKNRHSNFPTTYLSLTVACVFILVFQTH